MKFEHMFVVIFALSGTAAAFDFPRLRDWATKFSQSLGLGYNHTQELDQKIQHLLGEFQMQAEKLFEKALERTKGIYKIANVEQGKRQQVRLRRSADDKDGDGVSDEFEDIYNLLSVTPITRLDVTASTDIETFVIDGELFFAALNGSTNETQNEVKIFYWNNTVPGNLTLVQTLDTEDVHDIAAININGVIYLAVAESNSGSDLTGTVIYQFDQTLGQFEERLTLWATGARTVTSLEIEGVSALVVGAAYSTTGSDGLSQEMSTAYMWLGAHFDRFSEFATHGVTDIHTFTIHGRHYLAIANYADVKGNVNINSEILIYDSHLHNFEHFQFIETKGAKDWEYFGFGASRHREHFLAVVNNPNSDEQYTSMIYKFFDGRFVPFQCIETIGAERWHAVTDANDMLVLLALATANGVEFYEYDGWWFKATDYQYRQDSLGVSSFGFVSLLWDDKYILGVADGSDAMYNIFELTFVEFSPLEERHAEVAAQCETNKMRFENLTHDQEVMQNDTVNLVYINSDDAQIMTGNVEFVSNVTAANMKAEIVYVETGMVLDQQGLAHLAKIRSLYKNNTDELSDLEDLWNGTMKISGNQTVEGVKEFQSIEVTGELTVEAVTVESGLISGNISLHDLDNNTARTDRAQTFTGSITFADQVNMLSNLTVSGNLDNDIDTSHLVTLSRNHTITAQKTFQDIVNITDNLDVEGLIDSIDISLETIFLSYGDQNFTGDLTFLDGLLYEDDVSVEGLVDGIDLSTVASIAVLQAGNQNITGDKTFLGHVTMDTGMVTNDYLVDDVDIVSLNQTAVRLTVEQEITGQLNFSQDLSIVGNLQVDGSINGLNVPNDTVLIDEDSVTLTGTLTITNDVSIGSIWCEDAIDGIDCQDGTDLDLLLTSGNQAVSGHYIFTDDIWLDGSSNVTGLIDGIDVPEMAADALYDTGSQNISGFKVFSNSITFQDNIIVDLLIQEVNLTELDSRAIKLSDGLLDVDGQLVFDGTVTFEEDLLTNGYHDFGNLTLSDLVTQGSTEDIGGIKSFNTDVVSEDLFNVTGHVNDISLQELYGDVINTTDTSPRKLTGNYTFEDNITISTNLTVSGKVDGVTLTDIVNIDGPQVISGETTFNNDIQIGTLVIDGTISITNYINELTISDIANDTLLNTGDQHVTGTKTFQDGLTFGDNMTIDGLMDGVNITSMTDDAVHKTGDHIITSNKTFVGQTYLQDIDVNGTVCEVDIDYLYNRSVQQGMDQIITGNYTFLSNLYMDGNLTVLGNISGYQLEYEVAHMLLITDSVFDVELHFGIVDSEGDVDVDGLIDSIDVGAEAISEMVENQVITGKKTFAETVTLLENLFADTVNGVDIGDLADTTVYDTMNQTITAHKIFEGEMSLQKNLYVDGLVDGVNLTYIDVNVMRTEDNSKSEQRVKASASLENVHVLDVVHYEGFLDGVDLYYLNDTYLSLTRDQTIFAPKIFIDKITILGNGSLDGTNITLDSYGFINGINLDDFVSEVLMNYGGNQEASGVKIFASNLTIEGDVQVDGLLDSIDISANMMRTDTYSRVTGNKTFIGGHMVVGGDILMEDGLLVDDVDLSEWKQYAALTINDFILNSSVSIVELDLEQNLTVYGLIDDINLNTGGVLATFDDQTVTGHKSFVSDVNIQQNLNIFGYVNDIDVMELLSDTLLKSTPQVISGVYSLLHDARFGNLTTYGLLNGVRIPALYKQIYTYPQFDVLEDSLGQNFEVLKDVDDAQKNVGVFLEHIASLQDILTIGHGQWHGVEYGGKNYLIEAHQPDSASGCTETIIYTWNETTHNYQLETTLLPIMATAVDTFIDDGRLFMVVGSLTNDNAYACFDTWQPAEDAQPEATLPPGYSGGALTSIIVKDNATSDWYFYQHLSVIHPTDIEVFVNPLTGDLCIAMTNLRNAAYQSRLKVYIYCGNSTVGFSFWKGVPSIGGYKVKHFYANNELHLVVANQVDSQRNSFAPKSTLWKLEAAGNFQKMGQVTTNAVEDVLVIEIEGAFYILFANKFRGNFFSQIVDVPVKVYEYVPEGTPRLQWIQDIPAYGVRSLGHFKTQDQHFILILDHTETVSVYKFNGIRLFEHVLSLPVTGAECLEVLNLPDVNRIQIAVMCYSQIPIVFPGQPTGPQEIDSQLLEIIKEGEEIPASHHLDEESVFLSYSHD